jgi:hypothetical protein
MEAVRDCQAETSGALNAAVAVHVQEQWIRQWRRAAVRVVFEGGWNWKQIVVDHEVFHHAAADSLDSDWIADCGR